jgi:hypothetical protein
MVHQRNMPGTISPLHVRDYYERTRAAATSHTMRPPLHEVRILEQSSHSSACSSPDSASSASGLTGTPRKEDYQRLYTQSQGELAALRRVHARTVQENRRLHKAVQLFSAKCRRMQAARQGQRALVSAPRVPQEEAVVVPVMLHPPLVPDCGTTDHGGGASLAEE